MPTWKAGAVPAAAPPPRYIYALPFSLSLSLLLFLSRIFPPTTPFFCYHSAVASRFFRLALAYQFAQSVLFEKFSAFLRSFGEVELRGESVGVSVAKAVKLRFVEKTSFDLLRNGRRLMQYLPIFETAARKCRRS